VKTANSEASDLTKRRIDKATEVYEQIHTRELEIERFRAAVIPAIQGWEEASEQREADAMRHVNDVIAKQSQNWTDPVSAYDVWVEPSLRDPLDQYAFAVEAYQFQVGWEWPCIGDLFNAALTASSPWVGVTARPGFREKNDFDRRCDEAFAAKKFAVRAARDRFQRELDAFVNVTITPPGIWELIFGGRPKAPPPPPPRESQVEEEKREGNYRDGGGTHWVYGTPESRSAQEAKDTAKLMAEIAAAEAGDASARDASKP
jgi:hypothetical protein